MKSEKNYEKRKVRRKQVKGHDFCECMHFYAMLQDLIVYNFVHDLQYT